MCRLRVFLFNAVLLLIPLLAGAWLLTVQPAHAQYPGSGYPGSTDGSNTGYPGGGNTGGTGTGTGGTGYPGGGDKPDQGGYPGGGTDGSGTGGSGTGGAGTGGPITPGHWDVTYSSQGTTSWDYPTESGPQPGSYTWSTSASGDSLSSNYYLDADTTGTVTGTLTWVPTTGQDSTTDPPSSSVIVTETGYAAALGGGTGTATADDGWGDKPDQGGYPGGGSGGYPGSSSSASSSGTHYEVKDGTSGSITITKTLSASTPKNTMPDADGNFSAVGAMVSVFLAVAGTNPTITPGGAVPDSNNKQNILVGQGCTASLNTPPFDATKQSGWTWTVSGTTFQDWQPTSSDNPDASYYVGGSGPLINSTAHWFWNDPNTTTETITCTATVTPTDGKTAPFQVSATQKVKVHVPSYDAHGIRGYMQVNSTYNGDPNPELRAGPTVAMTANNQPVGMFWQASVSTPTQPAFGTGRLAFVQIAKPHSSYTNLAPPVQNHPNPNNGMTGLDGTFPYGDVVSEAQQPLTDNDNPDVHLVGLGPTRGDVAGSATFSSSYITYLMYRPPGSDDNTRWIALAQLSWSTNGSATIPDPNDSNSWSSFVTQNDPPDKAGTVSPNTWTSFAGVMGPAFVLSWTSVVRPPKSY